MTAVPILVRHNEDGDRATAALFALDSPAQVGRVHRPAGAAVERRAREVT